MISPLGALARLREGNGRFVWEVRGRDASTSKADSGTFLADQKPIAIILGCSDSRVPAEMIFDQGIGDLFVVRVAGNIVSSSQLGSIEFAAERFATRLVVVLGHSKCGAVQATLQEIEGGTKDSTSGLSSIVEQIRPSVEPVLVDGLGQNSDALLQRAVRANIRASVSQLQHGSPILEELIEGEGLLVVGAEYSLETGVVEFFDGIPEAD